MKVITLCLFIFVAIFPLFSVTIISENFSSLGSLPVGWTKTGEHTNAWSVGGTNYAGGAAGELQLSWTPSFTGLSRSITPAFDSRTMHEISVSFKTLLNDYSNSNVYTIGMQISHDLQNWTNVWAVTGTSSIPATTITQTIPISAGRSQTTYLAFYFEGNNYDINGWYLDDLLVSYTNTLATGTWDSDQYYITGDLIIPQNQSLTLVEGTILYFSEGCGVKAYGSLQVEGSENQPVNFSGVGSTWAGIDIFPEAQTSDSIRINYAIIQNSNSSAIDCQQYTKLRVSNSIISSNSSTESSGIKLFESDVLIQQCEFFYNTSLDAGASCIGGYESSARIYGSILRNNNCGTGSLINISVNGRANDVIDSYLTNNTCFSVISILDFGYMTTTSVTRSLIANNSGHGVSGEDAAYIVLNACDVVNNGGWGVRSSEWNGTMVSNSILSGNTLGQYFVAGWVDPTIYYSCLPGGLAAIGGGGGEAQLIDCVTGNPNFVNPTAGAGTSYSALAADWHLAYNSPCLDSADPALPLNEDGSRADIGMFQTSQAASIEQVKDVFPDQGHQVSVQWQRSILDRTFSPGAFYSVWRQGETSRMSGTALNDLRSFNPEQFAAGSCYYLTRDEIWYYVGNVPAVNFSRYGLIAPTLQDSTALSLNEETFIVIYHNNNGFWRSLPQSGYSVDNIAPDAPRQLSLSTTGENLMHLSWNRVTEGTYQGNSYPEINAINYRIHAGSTPDFIPGPENLLRISSDPWVEIGGFSQSRMFFKVIAGNVE